jgi:glycerol-3-phosphate dehydrogenase
MVGLTEPAIRGRKGEEYLLDKRLAGIVSRIIFPCPSANTKGILVIPTFDGTIMVGPTAEAVEDLEDVTTTATGSSATFDLARRLVPGISERDCIAEFAGVRAVAAGNDFVIGPTAVAGFVNVAGIQSPGLTAAPAIAEMVVEILGTQGFASDRLPRDDAAPRARCIALDQGTRRVGGGRPGIRTDRLSV